MTRREGSRGGGFYVVRRQATKDLQVNNPTKTFQQAILLSIEGQKFMSAPTIEKPIVESTGSINDSSDKNTIAILGKEGDLQTTWNPDNANEVAAAKTVFTQLTRSGHAAFRTDRSGKKTGEQIHEFDPNARTILLIPAMQGG